MSHSTLGQRWFAEVWNKKSVSAIDEMLSPDVVLHGLSNDGSPLKGPAGFKAFHAAFCSAFPDIHVDVPDMVEQGDRLAVRFVASGTHTGQGLGIDASGHRMQVDGMAIVRVQNGRIVEGWNLFDRLKLLNQIGVLPAQPI
jgi:steroid delta-isomerase-like uncharacterized protein